MEALHLVHKCGQLYANGITNRSTLYINDEQRPLGHIAQLVAEDRSNESDMEQVLNAASNEKTEKAKPDPDNTSIQE